MSTSYHIPCSAKIFPAQNTSKVPIMTQLHTQSSSRPRIKEDKLGEDSLRLLYEKYEQSDFSTFRSFAESLIQASSGKQATKDRVIAEFYKSVATKKSIFLITNNYVLAGMGLGV